MGTSRQVGKRSRLKGKTFRQTYEHFLYLTGSLNSRQHGHGTFPREVFLGFGQPALGFLIIAEKRIRYGGDANRTKQWVAIIDSQPLVLGCTCLEGGERNDGDTSFYTAFIE